MFLDAVRPYADITARVRHIGIEVASSILHYYDDSFYSAHHILNPKLSALVLRRAKQLRSYMRYYGIPSRRFFVALTYDFELMDETSWTVSQYLQQDVFNLFLFFMTQVVIRLDSRVESLGHFDRVFKINECRLRNYLDQRIYELSQYNHMTEAVDQAEEENHTDYVDDEPEWEDDELDWDEEIQLFRRARNIRGYHMALVKQVTEFWQEQDEFEKYCLGDFFALAEDWTK
ncbi:hypothetical protein E4T42_05167 [Aureobasidium subglaciale]|nr:hypothetical protein E4T42_05167 [Aureobasidium subglaciale]